MAFLLLLLLLASSGAIAGWVPPPVTIGAAATAGERLAAQELARYLGNMSSSPVVVTVLRPGQRVTAPTIAVGYDAALAVSKLGPAEMVVQLDGIHYEPGSKAPNRAANDSFFLTTRPKWVSPGSLIVTGSQGSPRGAIFGVYDLLRRMGCLFLAPDQSMDEELPTTAPTGFPSGPPGGGNNLDLMVRPSFVFRDAMTWPVITGEAGLRTAAKLGYNGKYAHADLPENLSVGLRYAQDGSGGQYFAHTAYKLLGSDRRSPPPELWANHREWFWPRDNNSTYGQLCASHIQPSDARSLPVWWQYYVCVTVTPRVRTGVGRIAPCFCSSPTGC